MRLPPYIKDFVKRFGRLPNDKELEAYIKLFVMPTKKDYEKIKTLPTRIYKIKEAKP